MVYTAPFSIMRFQVNGIYWEVIFVNSISNDLRKDDGSIALGVCDNNVKCIYISNALKGNLFQRVLIHELTHAWIFSYNFYLTFEEEEFICEFVSMYAKDILSKTDNLISECAFRICI